MIEKMIQKLQALDCDAWELIETRTRGWEFYFIRHALDQNRAVKLRSLRVVLYRQLDGGEMLGRAEGEIAPTATDAEIDKILADLLFQAGLVKNPVYELNDKPLDIPEAKERVDLETISENFIRAIRSVPETEEADINSYEIFAREIERYYRNSNGVEYRCIYPNAQVEVVVNARKEKEEIELIRVFDCGTCDADKLSAEVQKAMRYGRDRLRAVPTPETAPMAVVFSGSDTKEIYRYFLNRMMAAMKYRQMTDWEIGRPIGESFAGDRVSLEALAQLPNSSMNYPVDEEGARIRDRFLIRDGVAEEYWGSRQYSQYLGLSESSLVNNIRVSGGSKSEEDIREGDYLELVEFSDFQVDEIGCDFAGEIRLGYLHRGGEVTVVTGGSISGDMREAVKTMTFTKETTQYDSCEVPVLTRLENVRITGVKHEI